MLKFYLELIQINYNISQDEIKDSDSIKRDVRHLTCI